MPLSELLVLPSHLPIPCHKLFKYFTFKFGAWPRDHETKLEVLSSCWQSGKGWRTQSYGSSPLFVWKSSCDDSSQIIDWCHMIAMQNKWPCYSGTFQNKTSQNRLLSLQYDSNTTSWCRSGIIVYTPVNGNTKFSRHSKDFLLLLLQGKGWHGKITPTIFCGEQSSISQMPALCKQYHIWRFQWLISTFLNALL